MAILQADPRTQDSVLHCLAMIGRAANDVSESVKAGHAGVSWTTLEGMRDWAITQDDDGKIRSAHQVLSQHLPRMIRQVEAILAEQEAP